MELGSISYLLNGWSGSLMSSWEAFEGGMGVWDQHREAILIR